MVAAMPVERCALDVPSQQRRLARHTADEQPQHDAASREMARRGWAEVELVEDAGFSAGSLRRPGRRRETAAGGGGVGAGGLQDGPA